MALAPEDGTGANGVQLDVNAYGAAVLAMQIETHANITTRDSQAGAWEPFKALIGHYQATHLPIYLNSPRPPVDLAEAGPRHDLDQVVADNVGGVLSIETLRDFGITSTTTSHVTQKSPIVGRHRELTTPSSATPISKVTLPQGHSPSL